MTNEVSKKDDSSLMKIIQAIAISPDDARAVVKQYEDQIKKKKPNFSNAKIEDIVLNKIINRYSKLAGISGGTTSLAGIIPGIGTAISMTAGSALDISASIKLQIDMTMCLAVAINNDLSNEDAKHLSYIIALSGSIEQATSKGASELASKASVRLIKKHLTDATLIYIKELFKKVGIIFTQKAAIKVIPFGIGVVIGAGANYYLTKYVGRIAIETLKVHKNEIDITD